MNEIFFNFFRDLTTFYKVLNSKKKEAFLTVNVRQIGFFNLENNFTESFLKNQLKREKYIFNVYFFEWLHNCYLIICSCLISWFFGKIKKKIVWVFFSLLFFFWIYKINHKRFLRNIKDDNDWEFFVDDKKKVRESLKWFNLFFKKFWILYTLELSNKLKVILNDVLKANTPMFGIESLIITDFLLGSKAPSIEYIESVNIIDPKLIEMVVSIVFTPNDFENLSNDQKKNSINSKVCLKVTFSNLYLLQSIFILVNKISVSGKFNVKMKLIDVFPFVELVSIMFLEMPKFDYCFKHLGGELFGIDIMTLIPGLFFFVNNLITSNIKPIIVTPNHIDINPIDLIKKNLNNYSGVFEIEDFEIFDLNYDVEFLLLNIYISTTVVEKIKITKNESNKFVHQKKIRIIIETLSKCKLIFKLFGFKEGEGFYIGKSKINLIDFVTLNKKFVIKEFNGKNKLKEKIKLQSFFHFFSQDHCNNISDVPDTNFEIGVLRFTLTDLNYNDSFILSKGDLTPTIEFYLNDRLVQTIRNFKKSDNFGFNNSFTEFITNKSNVIMKIIIKNFLNNDLISNTVWRLESLIFYSSVNDNYLKLESKKKKNNISIGYLIEWRKVNYKNDLKTLNTFKSPIGCLRFHLRNATNLPLENNQCELNPSVLILLNGKQKGKSLIKSNTPNPVWNSVFYLTITNEYQHFLIDILNNKSSKDITLIGKCYVNVNDFLISNPKNLNLYKENKVKIISQKLKFCKSKNAELHYSIEFISISHANYNREDQKETLNNKHILNEFGSVEQKKLDINKKKLKNFDIVTNDVSFIDNKRINMSFDDVLNCNCGVILITINNLSFKTDKFDMQIFFDNYEFPFNILPKTDNDYKNKLFEDFFFTKDLKNSRIFIKFFKHSIENPFKNFRFEKKFESIKILKKSYDKNFSMRVNENISFDIHSKYYPSFTKLRKLDTVLDIGNVMLNVFNAVNLKRVNNKQKCDFILVIKLDGVQIHQTKNRRSSTHPTWNELIQFKIFSRAHQIIVIELYQWSMFGENEFIDSAKIKLSSIQPKSYLMYRIFFKDQGYFHLGLIFNPEYSIPSLSPSDFLPNFERTIGNSYKLIEGFASITSNILETTLYSVTDNVLKLKYDLIKKFHNFEIKKANFKKTDFKKFLGFVEKKYHFLFRKKNITNFTENSNQFFSQNKQNMDDNLFKNLKMPTFNTTQNFVTNDKKKKNSKQNLFHVSNFNSLNESDIQYLKFVLFSNDKSIKSTYSPKNNLHLYTGSLFLVSLSNYNASSLRLKVKVLGSLKDKYLFKTKIAKKHEMNFFTWNEIYNFKIHENEIFYFELFECSQKLKKSFVSSFYLIFNDTLKPNVNIVLKNKNGIELVLNIVNYSKV